MATKIGRFILNSISGTSWIAVFVKETLGYTHFIKEMKGKHPLHTIQYVDTFMRRRCAARGQHNRYLTI